MEEGRFLRKKIVEGEDVLRDYAFALNRIRSVKSQE